MLMLPPSPLGSCVVTAVPFQDDRIAGIYNHVAGDAGALVEGQ